jgi:DNA segregation ATPase FtsK/SpoIIIE-like protein
MNTNQKYPSFILGCDKDGADISYTLGPRESVILMAGTCGNGRTTLIQRIITQFINSYFSDEVQFILADTIGIAFGQYKGLPYLLKDPLTKPKEIIDAMDWILEENKRRTEIIKNSKDKNKAASNFPAVVFVIDEFSYLFKRDGIEHDKFTLFLSEFNKFSRYANTHIILSTQRREEEFITGQDLAYIPSRFIFHCLDNKESERLILADGAEKLKQGEFLYRNETMLEPNFCKIKNLSNEEIIKTINKVNKKHPKRDEKIALSGSKK